MTPIRQDAVISAVERHKERLDGLSEMLCQIEHNDSIKNYLSSLGDPAKDQGAAGRPTMDTRLLPHELEVLYSQNDLAAIIVDELVDEAFRKGYSVTTDEDDTDDPTEDARDDLGVDETFGDAAKWGRLYGGGFVLMVLDDGLDPSAPVELNAIDDVVQLIDLDRYEVTPKRWQTDIMQPGFGEPDQYTVTPAHEGGTTQGLGDGTVHASRLLQFGGAKLPRSLRAANNGYDDSILQRPWDCIRRFVEAEQGMANIIQAFETTTISISGLSQVLQDDEGVDLIRQRMQTIAEGMSLINAVLLDADSGEQVERDSASVAGLPELRQGFAESVAKAARYPQTILFGTAPSGLNTDGESGIQAWHKQVHAWQTNKVEPQLVWLYRCMFNATNGPTGGQEPDDWRIEWNPLDEPGEKEQAEIEKTVAETDAIYLDRAVRTPDQVARSRDSQAGWSKETLPRPDLEEGELDFGDDGGDD